MFRKQNRPATVWQNWRQASTDVFLFILFCLLGCHKGPQFHVIHFVGDIEIAESDSFLLFENLESIEQYADITK